MTHAPVPGPPDPEARDRHPRDGASPPSDGTSTLRARIANLSARVWTALVLGPAIIASLFVGPKIVFELIVLWGVTASAFELMEMMMPRHLVARAWGVLATLGLALAMLHPFPGAPVVALVTLVLVGTAATLVRVKPIETAAFRFGWLVAGPLYLGGLLSTLVLLHRLEHGGGWVLLAMLLAWFGDTGAYFAGWRFGKTKLSPEVSPAKTLEGAIGGLAGSVLAAVSASLIYLPTLPLGEGVVLALVAGSLGQLGDLGESMLKRATGVKDSGALLPGHGGVLDRIDALLFTAAVTWVYATFR